MRILLHVHSSKLRSSKSRLITRRAKAEFSQWENRDSPLKNLHRAEKALEVAGSQLQLD